MAMTPTSQILRGMVTLPIETIREREDLLRADLDAVAAALALINPNLNRPLRLPLRLADLFHPVTSDADADYLCSRGGRPASIRTTLHGFTAPHRPSAPGPDVPGLGRGRCIPGIL